MPTYTVTTANLTLSSAQKGQIAEAITTAHHVSTGAPAFFAQVIFRAIDGGDHFIGGKPNTHPHIFVHGMIRAGRGIDVKQRLMSAATDQVRAAAGIGAEDVWFYIQDIDAPQMIEFGRFLPEPGAEDVWRKAITPEKQSQLGRTGVTV
jgi:phenylpyruvate tautomerase PptA (4-oxalocrotonate tautomerase family)